MPGGSWSRDRLSMPNENLMLIGRDCHCASLQGFKMRPTSSQCQDLWSPKSKSWQYVSEFLGTQTESVRDRGNLKKRSELAPNSLLPSLPPEKEKPSRRLTLHAAYYPHESHKIRRLALGFGILSVSKITLLRN